MSFKGCMWIDWELFAKCTKTRIRIYYYHHNYSIGNLIEIAITMKWEFWLSLVAEMQHVTQQFTNRIPHYMGNMHLPQQPSVIQIKICAEYRDMLPRLRLVCQKPGLRLIGRSPGVPDKSSRGLGSMSRYSAPILICFIAYIFLFIPLVVWFRTLQDCQNGQCPLPLSILIRKRVGHQTIKAPSMLCWGAAGPSKHSLAFIPQTGDIGR